MSKCQEVDEPLLLDMSELSISDDFAEGNNGKHDVAMLVRFFLTYKR